MQEQLGEAKDKEVRMLTLRVAKQRTDTEIEVEEDEKQVQREFEFSRTAWPQSQEKAPEGEQRIMEARGGNALQFVIGSVADAPCPNAHTNKQAQHIIRQVINGQQFVLVAGKCIKVADAPKDIGQPQRQQALQCINRQLKTPRGGFDERGEIDLTEFFESILQIQKRGYQTPDRTSNHDSTPPRSNNNTSPKHIGDDDGDNDQWVLSIMRGDGDRKGN